MASSRLHTPAQGPPHAERVSPGSRLPGPVLSAVRQQPFAPPRQRIMAAPDSAQPMTDRPKRLIRQDLAWPRPAQRPSDRTRFHEHPVPPPCPAERRAHPFTRMTTIHVIGLRLTHRQTRPCMRRATRAPHADRHTRPKPSVLHRVLDSSMPHGELRSRPLLARPIRPTYRQSERTYRQASRQCPASKSPIPAFVIRMDMKE